MKRRGQPVHGFLNLDKPIGPSSAQAVARVRRALNAAKAGHAGTLDPFASGVLPIALGEATKVVSFLADAVKAYRLVVAWGEARATDDGEGAVVETSPKRPTRDEILAVLPSFRGAIRQVPPAYSALKIAGRRAYALARAGAPADLAPREVQVHRFDLEAMPTPDRAEFRVECGKGTYMRALARDLGRALGTAAHLAALERVQVGRFRVEDAIPLAKLEQLGHSAAASPLLLPIAAALDDIPALVLPRDEALRLRRGQSVPVLRPALRAQMETAGEGGTVLVLDGTMPVALVRVAGLNLAPLRVFNLDQGETV